MKGIYLASCRARHENYDLDYNDIDRKYKCNVIGNMIEINLENYDYIIATPPCNFWSRSNYRRETSEYAQKTKELLPKTICKLAISNKPFIIENVRNKKLMEKHGIYKLCEHFNLKIYYVGRHMYITNTLINLECEQSIDFRKNKNGFAEYIGKDRYRQGGTNVHKVIEIWLKYINYGIATNKIEKYEQLRLF